MLKYEEFSEKFELVWNFQKFLLEYFISEQFHQVLTVSAKIYKLSELVRITPDTS